LNTIEAYEDREALITEDEITENQVIPQQAEEEITAPPLAEPSKWLRLLQRLPHWNVEAMYVRDEREFAELHSFKPTSLSPQTIADIWILNSKL